MSDRLTKNVQWLIAAHPQWWLGAMLLTLHGSLAWGVDAWWSHGFLLAHFGLFLLWQPLWQGAREVTPWAAGGIVAGGALLVLMSSWWLVTIWVAVLIGLIGGNLPARKASRQRFVYLLALLYLLSLLLLWAVPNFLLKQESIAAVRFFVAYGLPILPLIIMIIRVEMRQPEITSAVDFFSSLMLFLLVVVLVLGSFTVMSVTGDIYPLALGKTVVAIGLILVALSWLWNPLGGFAGFGPILSRYLLSVGLPFEKWLRNLALLADREEDPSAFLATAVKGIAELPWMSGGEWRTTTEGGEFGQPSSHTAEFSVHDFRLVLYFNRQLSPALLMHTGLLAQLLGYFYEAKRREQLLRHHAYTQAVYETGARLTHDVKNLLQSLKMLCAVAETSGPAEAEQLQALIKRQLPQIEQRLQGTLDKLRAPQRRAEAGWVPAREWWEAFQARHANDPVEFSAEDIDVSLQVPGDLFDSVGDNFIQNALEKRKLQRNLTISVRLSHGRAGARLGVCDTGSAMEDQVARRLFEAPVKSEWGLGIGLYQAGRQARQIGYRLRVVHNEEGRVCLGVEAAEEEPHSATA